MLSYATGGMTVRPQGSLTGGNNAYSINDAPDRNARLYNAVHSNTGNKLQGIVRVSSDLTLFRLQKV